MRYRGREFTAKMYVGDINVEASCETVDATTLGDRSVRILRSEPTLRVNLELVSV